MNKKVIKTAIGLVIAELIVWYIIKIFFPEKFVLVVNNDRLIQAGNYVDNHWWIQEVIAFITSFATLWIYLCAVCQKKLLDKKEIAIVCITIIIFHIIYEYDINLANGFSIVSMLALPLMFKAEFKPTVVVFGVHYIAQLMSVTIRNLPTLLENVNTLSILIMTLDGYFWLFLFYLYYNYKKEE